MSNRSNADNSLFGKSAEMTAYLITTEINKNSKHSFSESASIAGQISASAILPTIIDQDIGNYICGLANQSPCVPSGIWIVVKYLLALAAFSATFFFIEGVFALARRIRGRDLKRSEENRNQLARTLNHAANLIIVGLSCYDEAENSARKELKYNQAIESYSEAVNLIMENDIIEVSNNRVKNREFLSQINLDKILCLLKDAIDSLEKMREYFNSDSDKLCNKALIERVLVSLRKYALDLHDAKRIFENQPQ